MCPLDYSLCRQTVTVYRREGETVTRQVLDGCHLEYRTERLADGLRSGTGRSFLLIVPGQEQRVFAGDRILAGVGPEAMDWAAFVPGAVEGLVQAQYAQPCFWEGQLCHTEAGR